MSESSDIYTVVMPKLGLTMIEGTLVKWYKGDGDLVEKGEMLFALESDKAILEIEAPASGVLRILVPVGQKVPVQTPVAQLLSIEAARGGASARLVGVAAATAPDPSRPEYRVGSAESRMASGLSAKGVRASPKARALARQRGLSLTGVGGTGARGMVTAVDVERVLIRCREPSPGQAVATLVGEEMVRATPVARKMAEEAGLKLSQVRGSGPRGQITRRDIEAALERASRASKVGETAAEAESAVEPLSGLRATIAKRLSAAWRERPQVTLTTEAEATNLVSARQQVIAEVGEKVSYDAFLVMLVARALREQPQFNVRLTERGIERLSQIHIGVAVDTERGLLVPVIQDVAEKDLLEIHRKLEELAERAKAGTLMPDDLSGGTFTITNLGMYEIDAFTPIVNPPECAILGVGRILAKPVVINEQVVVRQMMALSLSFDHRLIDGGPAARFLQRVKQLVERPFALTVLR